MTDKSPVTPSRRGFLRTLLLALPAFLILKRARPTAHDDIVEIDGWILKRSDLA